MPELFSIGAAIQSQLFFLITEVVFSVHSQARFVPLPVYDMLQSHVKVVKSHRVVAEDSYTSTRNTHRLIPIFIP